LTIVLRFVAIRGRKKRERERSEEMVAVGLLLAASPASAALCDSADRFRPSSRLWPYRLDSCSDPSTHLYTPKPTFDYSPLRLLLPTERPSCPPLSPPNSPTLQTGLPPKSVRPLSIFSQRIMDTPSGRARASSPLRIVSPLQPFFEEEPSIWRRASLGLPTLC
jgi:hypothetical protein